MDGILRLSADYRRLNKRTQKIFNQLLLIQDKLMHMSNARWYIKLDIWNEYNLLCIRTGNKWKTVFRISQGLFTSLVMSFSLKSASASF